MPLQLLYNLKIMGNSCRLAPLPIALSECALTSHGQAAWEAQGNKPKTLITI